MAGARARCAEERASEVGGAAGAAGADSRLPRAHVAPLGAGPRPTARLVPCHTPHGPRVLQCPYITRYRVSACTAAYLLRHESCPRGRQGIMLIRFGPVIWCSCCLRRCALCGLRSRGRRGESATDAAGPHRALAQHRHAPTCPLRGASLGISGEDGRMPGTTRLSR